MFQSVFTTFFHLISCKPTNPTLVLPLQFDHYIFFIVAELKSSWQSAAYEWTTLVRETNQRTSSRGKVSGGSTSSAPFNSRARPIHSYKRLNFTTSVAECSLWRTGKPRWRERMDVFLAFHHMFVLGTRAHGLIKQLWLLNSWVSLRITGGCRISGKHVGHPQKNTAEGRYTSHNPSARRNLLRQRSEWPVLESAPLRRCGRLIGSRRLTARVSLCVGGLRPTTPGCQQR